MRSSLLLCILSLLIEQAAFGQADSARESSSQLVILPIISYAPETKLALGAYGAYYFRPEDEEKSPASALRASVAFTTRKQFLISTSPDVFLVNGRWRFNGELSFAKYADKFFGIGNSTLASAEEEYTTRRLRFNARGLVSIMERTKVGLVIDDEYHTTTEFAHGGLLSTVGIPGNAGGTTIGYGVAATFDSRDHIVAATNGTYLEANATFFPQGLGSDFDFNQFVIDARTFFSGVGEHVIGLHAYGKFNSGSPPFQRLAALGGSYRMRGLYEGRFRDRHMIELQAEYRFPLAGKFGLVGFVGTGDVASGIGKFVLSEFKYSAGAGLRYLIAPKEKVNIRLDVGFASEKSSGVYLTIEEAF